MPSTDRKLELTAKASMAQPVSQTAVCSNGLTHLYYYSKVSLIWRTIIWKSWCSSTWWKYSYFAAEAWNHALLKVVPRLKFLPFTRKKDALLQHADLRDVFKLMPSVSVCLSVYINHFGISWWPLFSRWSWYLNGILLYLVMQPICSSSNKKLPART